MNALTADKILSAKTVGEIFSNDESTIRSDYVALSKKWHPDYNGNSEESNKVMAKINLLYEKALDLLSNNKWEGRNFIRLNTKENNIYDISYLKEHPFELGKIYVCEYKVVYVINSAHSAFYNNYKSKINLTYINDSMRKEFSRYVPNSKAEFFVTKENDFVIAVPKTDDLVLLKDVLSYYGGKVPDRHVAWIMSSLYNLACFIEFNKISHNGITIDNYFISPSLHSGALLGGWWYATNIGSKMLGVSSDVYKVIPPKEKDKKQGNIVTDLESIRLIGRQLLGETSGYGIRYNKELPKAFIDWLLMGSSATAFDEYRKWNIALTNAYGAKKFINMGLSASMIYKTL